MCQREEFILLYKINYNIFELPYSLQKEPKLQKRANKFSKTRCKNENKNLIWETDYRYTFDSVLQGFSRKRSDFGRQFGFFLFCFNIFWFHFFELNIFFKFSNNGIKQFTAECLYTAPLSKVSIKFFTGSAKIPQKRYVSSEVYLWDSRSFLISLCLFYFIVSLSFFIFKFIDVPCKKLSNN